MHIDDLQALLADLSRQISEKTGDRHPIVVLTVNEDTGFSLSVYERHGRRHEFKGTPFAACLALTRAWIASDQERDGNLTLGLSADGTRILISAEA